MSVAEGGVQFIIEDAIKSNLDLKNLNQSQNIRRRRREHSHSKLLCEHRSIAVFKIHDCYIQIKGSTQSTGISQRLQCSLLHEIKKDREEQTTYPDKHQELGLSRTRLQCVLDTSPDALCDLKA